MMEDRNPSAPGITLGEPLRYQIVRSKKRRRTLVLCVERSGKVLVRAPVRATQDAIHAFVREKRRWIEKKLSQVRQEQIQHKPRAFLPGEKFLYLGKLYPLRITNATNGQPPLHLLEGEFHLTESVREKAKDLFMEWYRKEAETIIRQRIGLYRDTLQVHPTKERITSARCQWGGCSARNTLTFSWRIIMAPLHVIDYVVIHELAHIREKNHSPKFWKIVEATLPNYRDHRDWLKQQGHLLTATGAEIDPKRCG